MVYIVLLLTMECLMSSMLIFENFSQDSFMIWILLAVSLDVHAASMDSIELVFNVSWCSWRSLSSSCTWVGTSLSDWWSWDINLGSWPGDQILSLITARLDHQTLVINLSFLLDRACINWLPSIFGCSLWPWMRNHAVDEATVVLSTICLATSSAILTFSLSTFLINKSHW